MDMLKCKLVVGAVSLLASSVALADIDDRKANELMNKAGCAACHKVDGRSVGPAYKDVAKKYKGQKGIEGKLAEKVRKGGAGVWGPVPMAPTGADKIADADLKHLVEWILKR